MLKRAIRRSISAGTLLISGLQGIQDKHKSRKWTKQDKNINKKEMLEKEKGHFVNNMRFLMQVTRRGKFTFKNYVSQNS